MRVAPRSRARDSLAALLFLASTAGCDIVQGLADAGNAIFPGNPTHVNAPGSRLAAGNYSALDFAGVWLGKGTIGFKLLARTAVPGDDSLSVIGFTDGRVCRVEHVGAYRASSVAGPGEVLLSYLDGPGPRGTLRFVDPECEPLPAVLTDAALWSAILADGRQIVVAGDDLVLVDAEAGIVEPFEPGVERVKTRSGGPYLVQASGHLSIYDDDWRLVSRHGEQVVASGYHAASSRVVFEDAHGIWFTGPLGGDAISVASGACDLGFPSWQPLYVTFRKPCDDGQAVAFAFGSVETIELGLEIDPRNAEFWTSGPPADLSLWVAHFRDFDEAAGIGTLYLRAEDGRDVILGERAAPEWVQPLASGDEGHALVNVDGDVGDLIHFDTSGAVQVLAERALRHNDGVGLIVNFDGEVGDMGILNTFGGFALLLSRVPPHNYTYVNRDLTIGAAVNDFDGRTGTLSRFTVSFSKLEPVATRVLHPQHGFIEALFPGMAWIRADGGGDTGTLEYQNTDLVYTAVVSEGVAAFLPTTEGLIYSVPHGAGAGVWFADAK